MTPTRFVRFTLLAASTVVLLSCESTVDPNVGGLPDTELTFLRFAEDAPPLEDTVVSFYAKRGTDREIQIRYRYEGGLAKCLLFRVPALALLRRPDGSTFAMGDSVRVTIRVVDKSRYQYQFEPAGLQFDPAHPAELEVRYNWADPDYNRDGVVDAADAEVESGIAFWRQERVGERWHKIEGIPLGSHEIRAAIRGFTQYALASDRSGSRVRPD